MYSRVQLQIIHLYAFSDAVGKFSYTKEEMLDRIPCDRRTLNAAIKMLTQKSCRCIYIASWTRTRKPKQRAYLRPAYAFGNREDAPKPAPRARSWYKEMAKLAKQKVKGECREQQ